MAHVAKHVYSPAAAASLVAGHIGIAQGYPLPTVTGAELGGRLKAIGTQGHCVQQALSRAFENVAHAVRALGLDQPLVLRIVLSFPRQGLRVDLVNFIDRGEELRGGALAHGSGLMLITSNLPR